MTVFNEIECKNTFTQLCTDLFYVILKCESSLVTIEFLWLNNVQYEYTAWTLIPYFPWFPLLQLHLFDNPPVIHCSLFTVDLLSHPIFFGGALKKKGRLVINAAQVPTNNAGECYKKAARFWFIFFQLLWQRVWGWNLHKRMKSTIYSQLYS